MEHWRVEELKERAICTGCVGEEYLSGEISRDGAEQVCHYCGERGKSYTLEEIAGRIEQAFEDHYTRTSTDADGIEWAMQKDPEIDYSWEREGEQTIYAIMNAADIPEEAAGDIQVILADEHGDFEMDKMGEETPFAEEAHYEEIMPSDEEWQEGWRDFEQTIKSEARFFSRTAAAQLSALFDDIDQLHTRGGEALVVNAGPDTSLSELYRARAFHSDERLKAALMRPDRELSAPPSFIAAAGRMNAKGISTFYGATEPHIALAEVRPPVGSQVAIARFEIIRPLRLLDLNKLEQISESGSIFDPSYARRLGRMMFLRKLTGRISRPVMPDDQDSEYLATQAIADYLATEGKVPLDGIIFPSVQAGNEGVNVVLFQKASRTVEIDFPKGTDLSAETWHDTADGPEREYSVIERVPPEPETRKPATPSFFDPSAIDWAEPRGDYDDREVTLRIDPAGITVHVVEAVSFKTDEHTVRRYRWTKLDATDEPF
ncbi:RES domain-containing protein [Mesorhizobium sp. B3-1-9]|uniref:RES family NAD+ phosphorylase n=1 Tax=Mesorhizobium sp. B3-1-9 TaxID=2589892 RepID=UPI0011263359|nr:RES family NAD+ phosphorylase [Mesorhizobium sp. B3-1-9]TPI29246.1 RES domain-containing protein [Mesorhizobium sp. B3-1-9]